MILDELSVPIVLAPMAGGPFTPGLAAAVSEGGGLGFVAAGYLDAATLGERISQTRALTTRAIAVNLFVPGAPSDPAGYRSFAQLLAPEAARAGVALGQPHYDDDDWQAKLDLLVANPVPVVSFTFGCPPGEVVSRLHAGGSETWVTVTSPEEARQAAEAGADVVVAQGGEAGGHRASFVDRPDLPVYGLLALIELVGRAVDLPVVATGGISTGRGVAAVLCAGARAAQLGTAFMRCPEAGTTAVHRRALAGPAPTALTRAFTGRLARGIRNRFMIDYGAQAPLAYPEVHSLTAPLRQHGRERSDGDVINLWAGEGHELAQERPAAEILTELGQQARHSLGVAGPRRQPAESAAAAARRNDMPR